MKLLYVVGGGWGHLQRVQLFIRQFNIASFRILTNNPVANRLFDQADVLFLKEDQPEKLSDEIQSYLKPDVFDEIYIDTFPAGMFGELRKSAIRRQNYLARRLRWDTYQHDTDNTFFTTYTFEELEPAHTQYIVENSRNVIGVSLNRPSPQKKKLPTEISADHAVWLIVHAFVQEEVEMLLQYAKETALREQRNPVFVVITDQAIQNERDVFVYNDAPAINWFPLAERIFAGGGFNTVNELKPFAGRTTLIPFPRRYDDQAWRVNQFRKS